MSAEPRAATVPHLLIVDDDPAIREIARLALERVVGWTVETVESGDLAMASVSARRPDAILLDVMMPGEDGPTILARLRDADLLGDTPVLFLTAHLHLDELERRETRGAAGVLHKPFDAMTLGAQVAQALGWAPPEGRFHG